MHLISKNYGNKIGVEGQDDIEAIHKIARQEGNRLLFEGNYKLILEMFIQGGRCICYNSSS